MEEISKLRQQSPIIGNAWIPTLLTANATPKQEKTKAIESTQSITFQSPDNRQLKVVMVNIPAPTTPNSID